MTIYNLFFKEITKESKNDPKPQPQRQEQTKNKTVKKTNFQSSPSKNRVTSNNYGSSDATKKKKIIGTITQPPENQAIAIAEVPNKAPVIYRKKENSRLSLPLHSEGLIHNIKRPPRIIKMPIHFIYS